MTKNSSSTFRRIITAVATVGLVFVLSLVVVNFTREPRVLQSVAQSDQVEVRASVYGCELEIKVHPEKRIPRTGNWDTLLTIDLFDNANSHRGTLQAESNNQGVAIIDICSRGLTLPSGLYNLYIRGFSHLRKRFPDKQCFSSYRTTLDLTTNGQVLFAGETSNIFDNKINALDISTQIVAMYSGSVKNDLNQDGKVNSLDISNTITNFFMLGE
jgi:hypothetical protein